MTPTRAALKVGKNLSAPLILRLILFPKVVPKTSHRFYLTFDAPPSEIMTMRARDPQRKVKKGKKAKKSGLNGEGETKPAEVKETTTHKIHILLRCAVIIISKVDRVIKRWRWTKLEGEIGRQTRRENRRGE